MMEEKDNMATPTSYLLNGQFLCNEGAIRQLVSPSGFYNLALESYMTDVPYASLIISLGSQGANDPYLWQTLTKVPAVTSFIALMQGDGNFCIYRGYDPGHADANSLWCSGSWRGPGAYYVILQDDGDLRVYTGNVIGQGTLLWQSGSTDAVVSIQFLDFKYDLSAGTITELDTYELSVEPFENDGDSPKQVIVKGSDLVPESGLWAEDTIVNPDSIQFPAFLTSSPRVMGGKLVDGAWPQSGIINKETESGRQWGWYELVTVPPDSEVEVSVTVQMAKIIVPFMVIGRVTFKSGKWRQMYYSGTFSGITSHDMTIKVTPFDAAGGGKA
jgi:hypothetical protein